VQHLRFDRGGVSLADSDPAPEKTQKANTGISNMESDALGHTGSPHWVHNVLVLARKWKARGKRERFKGRDCLVGVVSGLITTVASR
jgi:hypothetical protein